MTEVGGPRRHQATPGREIGEDQVTELARLGLDYWWYAVRIAHIASALRDCKALDLLDFGCGEGTVTASLVERLQPRTVQALDGTIPAVELARSRGLPARLVDFRQPFEVDPAPTAITCLDVLEHLEDPERALRHLAQVAASEARLVVTVPAMPSLHSRWDDLAGHLRRYTRPLLYRHLRESGWKPRRLRYVFSWCVPPAWVERRLLKRVQEFEFPHVSPFTNSVMIWAGALERRIGSPFPFGTSLLAVAERG